LVLAALQPVVNEIFEISRFNAVFPIYPGVREALAELSPPALDALDAA
jgi:anti-anti-sigma regulatory factor